MTMRALSVLLSAVALCGAVPAIDYDQRSEPLAFAAAEIRAAAGARQVPPIVLRVDGAGAEQSYRIRRNGQTITVTGHDAAGAMYGGLDIAEAIRLGTLDTLPDSDHSPHVARRGIKFNIPLDVRTPSYSDNSDAAQLNIPEMWSRDFWHAFLDDMARHRYNVLSLWNLHPFPSLVKVPEFPDVALDDVVRTRVPMDDTYSHNGDDMLRPVLLTRTETVRKMRMNDKIEFWREVMRYANARGIEVYWFTWNIFAFGAEGKYGITAAQDNRQTIAYFRASVRELVKTYPLLAGIGITAGEHMRELTGEFSKEAWLASTYGAGIKDALKLEPSRKFRLIHRYHQTGQAAILEAFHDYPGPFELSFKYAIAHMYSVPNPPFIKDALPYIQPEHRAWLTVRDDDVYSFRWGDASYAREFIRNIPPSDKIAGFYMGPDGTIWGRESSSVRPKAPRETVIGKRWYSFMLWGRLAYDPDLPNELFSRTLAVRFPEADTATLMEAWAQASSVFPRITRFFWGDIDLRWFPEACLSHPKYRGFYTVRHFMEGLTMPGSGIADILEWRNGAKAALGPLDVAAGLAGSAARALELTAKMRGHKIANTELAATLTDIESMAHLANYYAAKIRGASDLARFDLNANPAHRETAVNHLNAALEHWKRYSTAYTQQYRARQLYNRVGWVDIPGLTEKVAADVEMARSWTPHTIPDTPRKRAADTPFKP